MFTEAANSSTIPKTSLSQPPEPKPSSPSASTTTSPAKTSTPKPSQSSAGAASVNTQPPLSQEWTLQDLAGAGSLSCQCQTADTSKSPTKAPPLTPSMTLRSIWLNGSKKTRKSRPTSPRAKQN